MFDIYALTEAGFPYGGFGKGRNMTDRTFTAWFKWKSRPFKQWLDTVMKFHQLGTDWNPRAVGDWWDRFLAQYGETLPSGDRRNNLEKAGKQIARDGWETPQHVKGNPQQSTKTSPLFLPPQLNPGALKRKADAVHLSDPGEDEETAPPEKQRRTMGYEILSPDSELSASPWGLQPYAWRDGPPIYSATTSALTTPTGGREESYETDGEYTTKRVHGHFLSPDLARMMHQLGGQHPDEEEVAKGGDVKGKGRAVR